MKCLVNILFLLAGLHISAQNVSGIIGTDTDTSWFRLVKPDFNSESTDFSVAPSTDGYVFSSSRNNNVTVRYFSSDPQAPLLDLYYVKKQSDGGFTTPEQFADKINSRANNEGPATFTADGNTIIFTGNQGEGSSLTLMQSVRHGNKWSTPVPLSFCTPQFNYVHPSLYSGDSVLFFASDVVGGYGGMDIYFVKKVNGAWSSPVNAGSKINSEANELFPFCSASGILYFSSKRISGMGGYDIYAIPIADSAAFTSVALAVPINSADDDFGFSISAANDEGFFSSNRGNEKNDDDIYYFTYQWPVAERSDTILPVELCYDFYEEATARTGDTALMKYTWNFSDGETKYGYAFKKCFDTTGSYRIHLSVRDSSGGDVVISDIDYDFLIAQPNYTSFRSPDTIASGKIFEVRIDMIDPRKYEINHAYVDFGNGFVAKEKSATHTYFRRGTYYPKAYLLLKNKETGATESRCVVKKIIVI